MKETQLASEGWGDGAVSKALLAQAWGPDFKFLLST